MLSGAIILRISSMRVSFATNDTTGYRELTPGLLLLANWTDRSNTVWHTVPRIICTPSNELRMFFILDARPFVENCQTPTTPRTAGTMKSNCKMGGRIYRPEQGAGILELPEIGRLHIGKKQMGQNGKEYPVSVDYFIPAGKYAGMFTQALGEKPQTIQVIFPDDSPEKVCNERYEYRDDKGALVARGDGRVFEIWDGKRYAPYSWPWQ